MLREISDIRSMKYYFNKTILLYNKDKYVLFQRKNKFSFNKLNFNLVYKDLNDKQYIDYIIIRNQSLKQIDKEMLSSRVFAISRKTYVKINNLILYDNINNKIFELICVVVEITIKTFIVMKKT